MRRRGQSVPRPAGWRFADAPVAAAENRPPHARMPAVPQKRRDADRSDMLIMLGPRNESDVRSNVRYGKK